MKSPWLIIVLAALAFAIGFELNPKRLAKVETQVEEPASGKRSLTSRGSSSTLEKDFEQSHGTERWLRFVGVLEKATLDDLPELALSVQDEPRLVNMIARRWFDLDPQDLLDTAIEQFNLQQSGDPFFDPDEYLSLLAAEWAGRDMPAVIQAIKEKSDDGAFNDFIDEMFAGITKVDPIEAMKLAISLPHYSLGSDSPGARKWVAADPVRAFHEVLKIFPRNTDPNAVQSSFRYPNPMDSWMGIVAKQLAIQSPEEGLKLATTIGGPEEESFLFAFFEKWADHDHEAAGVWLSEQESAVQKNYRDEFVSEWAGNDLEAAFRAQIEEARSSDSKEINLNDFLQYAIEQEGNIDVLINFIPQIEELEIKKGAAEILADDLFTDSYEKGLPWFESLADPEVKKHVLERTADKWAEMQPESLERYLAENPEAPYLVYQSLAKNLAREDPRYAMEWAEKIPQRHREGAAERVMSMWKEHYPGIARSWLESLSSDDPRRRFLNK